MRKLHASCGIVDRLTEQAAIHDVIQGSNSVWDKVDGSSVVSRSLNLQRAKERQEHIRTLIETSSNAVTENFTTFS